MDFEYGDTYKTADFQLYRNSLQEECWFTIKKLFYLMSDTLVVLCSFSDKIKSNFYNIIHLKIVEIWF